MNGQQEACPNNVDAPHPQPITNAKHNKVDPKLEATPMELFRARTKIAYDYETIAQTMHGWNPKHIQAFPTILKVHCTFVLRVL